MIQNEEEYRYALEELKKLETQTKSFDEVNLIKRGYPIWIIRQQKWYIKTRPAELQSEIAEYLKANPKAGYRISKFKRYKRSRNKPTNHK